MTIFSSRVLRVYPQFPVSAPAFSPIGTSAFSLAFRPNLVRFVWTLILNGDPDNHVNTGSKRYSAEQMIYKV